LHFEAGYVTNYAPLDQDTDAVMWDPEVRVVTLHTTIGDIHRFVDAGEFDPEGHAIYREVPRGESTVYAPGAASRQMLPLEQTFDYVATVTMSGKTWSCHPRCLDRTSPPGLVGVSPVLDTHAIGLLKGGGVISPLCDVIRPSVHATRVVLTAAPGVDSAASAASFCVDQTLVEGLRAGDVVHLTRTPRGGLGLSVVRSGELLFAIGAVSAVPLGPHLNVAIRRDRLARPLCDGRGPDLPWLHPIHFTCPGCLPGKPRGYDIRVFYGAWPAPHDVDECVVITRDDMRPKEAATVSALLLAVPDALEVTSLAGAIGLRTRPR